MTISDIDFIEDSSMGSYEPGFIHLRIDTIDDLKKAESILTGDFNECWSATFLHEYIHYLQDLTTSFGLFNFISKINFLKNANTVILNNRKGNEFSVPLDIPNTYNFLSNEKLLTIYNGDSRGVDEAQYISYSKEIQKVNGVNGVIEVPQFYVKYHDKRADQSSVYHFGARQIKESMAHIIQRQYEPQTTKCHRDYPYRLVEQILETELPNMEWGDELVITLCECCLFIYNCGELFFHTIDRIKKEEPSIKLVNELSEYMLGRFNVQDLDENTQTVKEQYIKDNNTAQKYFNDALKDGFQELFQQDL